MLALRQALCWRSEASMLARAWTNAHQIASSKVSHGPLIAAPIVGGRSLKTREA
jgi:hypothetical protein